MTEIILREKAKKEAVELIKKFTKEGMEEHAKWFAIVCCTEIMQVAIQGGHIYSHYERIRQEIEKTNP